MLVHGSGDLPNQNFIYLFFCCPRHFDGDLAKYAAALMQLHADRKINRLMIESLSQNVKSLFSNRTLRAGRGATTSHTRQSYHAVHATDPATEQATERSAGRGVRLAHVSARLSRHSGVAGVLRRPEKMDDFRHRAFISLDRWKDTKERALTLNTLVTSDGASVL